MPTIDADAHVIESEETWRYMKGSEDEFRPKLVSPRKEGKKPGSLMAGNFRAETTSIGRYQQLCSKCVKFSMPMLKNCTVFDSY